MFAFTSSCCTTAPHVLEPVACSIINKEALAVPLYQYFEQMINSVKNKPNFK